MMPVNLGSEFVIGKAANSPHKPAMASVLRRVLAHRDPGDSISQDEVLKSLIQVRVCLEFLKILEILILKSSPNPLANSNGGTLLSS
jgi:hypothetical protein